MTFAKNQFKGFCKLQLVRLFKWLRHATDPWNIEKSSLERPETPESWLPNHNMGTKERCRREKMVPEASTSDSEAPIQETRQPLAAPEACHLCGGGGGGRDGQDVRFRPAVEGGYRREVRKLPHTGAKARWISLHQGQAQAIIVAKGV